MKILITGVAGFIGFHLANKLLKQKGVKIIGIDNLNNYYDKKIKKQRLKILKKNRNFSFIFGDLKKSSTFRNKKIKKDIKFVYHFAGQAGVRYSIKKPNEYIKDNIISYINLLEHFKKSKKLKNIFYASSSSIYGDKAFSSSNFVSQKPISVYAVSKLSMELLSNVYFNLYNLKTIGNPKTVSLKKFIDLLEKNISLKVKKIYKKKQPGDVLNTKSNINIEKKLFNFKFKVDLELGLRKFINWFLIEYEKS